MPKIKASSDFSKIKTAEEFQRFVSIYLAELSSVINGKLEFQDNIKCQIVGVSFEAGATDLAVPHSLGRVPTGYMVTRLFSGGVMIYDGNEAWTDTTIYLRSSGATGAEVLIF